MINSIIHRLNLPTIFVAYTISVFWSPLQSNLCVLVCIVQTNGPLYVYDWSYLHKRWLIDSREVKNDVKKNYRRSNSRNQVIRWVLYIFYIITKQLILSVLISLWFYPKYCSFWFGFFFWVNAGFIWDHLKMPDPKNEVKPD